MEVVDLLRCSGCDRTFTSVDGQGMLRAIKAPCECGGWFEAAGQVSLDEAIDWDGAAEAAMPSSAEAHPPQ